MVGYLPALFKRDYSNHCPFSFQMHTKKHLVASDSKTTTVFIVTAAQV